MISGLIFSVDKYIEHITLGKTKQAESSRIPNSDLGNCLNILSNFFGSDHKEVL